MSMNSTPAANRIHIGFFGCRNAGKSSIVNAVTNQEVAVVSDTKGTTTDPVSKSMELLPLGAVVITDTPGFDDVGELGELRVRRTKQILNKTDVAVLVIDGTVGMNDCDRQLIEIFKEKEIPYVVAYNKSDISAKRETKENEVSVSAVNGDGIEELKEKIGKSVKSDDEKKIVGDLINSGDTVVLVVPIDEAAPKGRLILPQQQTIRDILEAGAISVVARDTELDKALSALSQKPAMVICDSQVFRQVADALSEDIVLTSFSILMARYKGFLESAVNGICAIENLKDGDTVLVSEGCTHHRQCGDIGTVKIPALLKKYTGKSINIESSSGGGFPDDLSKYSLIIHCGGCMLSEREVRYRMKCAEDAGVPFTNYGTAIAYMNGILKRSLAPFPSLADKLK
ncbi:MAG: [FeFe] hydrogenase H-cluster maturation GTPase HydF [Clostridia bacterium]|nr:[FeFe] hydrogenase H-cluster maturation GTPase HydF [Clostridia bacterium]